MSMNYDLLVVGTGAAGLSAAIYGGRYRMKVAVFGDNFGGYTSVAGTIENYPGYVEIDGFDLMIKMKEQAQKTGAAIFDVRVALIERQEDGCFTLTTKKGDVYYGKSVIIATGTEHRQMGLPHENELTSKGVHYCATCDAPMYKDKTIAVVGGGDGAIKGATLAAEYAAKIYLLVRAEALRAEPINVDQLMKFGDKVQICYGTQVTALHGTERLEGISVSQPINGSTDLSLDGLFVEIGANPRVELAEHLGMTLDEKGYIKTDSMMRSNIPGAFGAGDSVNLFEGFKQDITAAAMGAIAATSAYNYTKVHGNLCSLHWLPEEKETISV